MATNMLSKPPINKKDTVMCISSYEEESIIKTPVI